MTKANADTKAAERNAAVKKAAAKGITEPKHTPAAQNSASDAPTDAENPTPNSALGSFAMSQLAGGVDTTGTGVVQSGFATGQGANMTDPNTPTKTKAELDAERVKASMEAKQAKIAAKAKADAERAAKKQEKEAERLKAIADRAEARKLADEKRAADKAANPGAATTRERTYTGTMLALSERVKDGIYTKGLNGQLRSNDQLATILEAVPAPKMVQLLLAIMKLSENPYAAYNYGQQSMNLRNKLRGLIRRGGEVGEVGATVKVTYDYIKQVRDDGGFATAEAEIQAAKEAKEKAKQAREAKLAEAKAAADKAAKDKADAKAKADAEAKATAEAKPAEPATA